MQKLKKVLTFECQRILQSREETFNTFMSHDGNLNLGGNSNGDCGGIPTQQNLCLIVLSLFFLIKVGNA